MPLPGYDQTQPPSSEHRSLTMYRIEYVDVEGSDQLETLGEYDLLSRLKALATIGIDEVKVNTHLWEG